MSHCNFTGLNYLIGCSTVTYLLKKKSKKLIHLRSCQESTTDPDNFILELKALEDLPEILPGQFVQVLVENTRNVFLRRPFSIHDVDYKENTISLLIKRIGTGTRQLCYLEEGDFLNLVYPLGNSFTIKEDVKNVLLVGGGCGVAPLMLLARYYFDRDVTCNVLVGGRTAEDVVETDKYAEFGNVFATTEDGSMGEKGRVTDHSIFKGPSNQFDFIYSWVSPEPMMEES